MTRRDFMKATTAGAIASSGGVAAAASAEGKGLPQTQSQPLPDLGTHWPIFEKLSAKCRPKMSFLEDKYTDPLGWADEARALLLADLHYTPEPCNPAPEVTDRADLGAYTRERIEISTTPEIRVPAYLLIPKDAPKPCPAAVCLHDHGGFYFWGKEKLVQVENEHPALTEYKKVYYGGRSIADELAKRGFVVIVPDMLHWGERGLYLADDPERIKKRTLEVTPQDIIDFNARSWAHEELIGRTALTCGVTWPGIMAWDDYRVTDYLLTRPEVDPKRVGCCGLSLGSVRSIYLGALHPAVRASAAVCWMAEYQPMARNNVRNGIGFTKLVPGLYGDLDWPDVGGLHLPGCLMTVNGLQDKLYPLEAAKAAVEKLQHIFAKAGSQDNYEGVYFDGPHEFNMEMQETAFAWLTKKLA
ncbi:MAG: dienelactone hydrolase family protein [Candidatus Hydrogenedentes bacterium]|nr:dienelactone hydrolase family protein [Candidatus Hydrogenedentota bacterium]